MWVSPRRTITEADVIQFATMTGDFNPLHVDYDFASKSHYRQPIAHGLLGLSWVAGLGSHFPLVNTLAFTAVRNWEFSRPLFLAILFLWRRSVLRKRRPEGVRARLFGSASCLIRRTKSYSRGSLKLWFRLIPPKILFPELIFDLIFTTRM